MPANKKISQFDLASLGSGPDGNDWLGGYREEGLGDLNPNIRYNMASYSDWLLAQVSSGNAGKSIINGGATYSGIDLDFIVAVTFNYFGNIGFAELNPATLNPGDLTNPRFDLFVVEINAGIPTIEVIEGVPDANPVIPYPGENQIAIQPVLIAAGATVPSISQTIVYEDHAPGEWIITTYNLGGSSAGTFNPESIVSPYQGTYCIAALLNTARGLKFTALAPISLNDYPVLAYFVRFPAPVSADRRLLSSVGYLGAGVGNVVDFMNYGLDRNSTAWQQIIIPTSLYNVIANDGQIDRIHLRMDANDRATTAFFLDYITFSTGIPTPPPATPGWAQVLGVDTNSGANSPRINNGQKLIFDTVIGQIMSIWGSVGDEGLTNIAGNLFWKVNELGVTDGGLGAGNNCTMYANGRIRALSFFQNIQLTLAYAASLTWNWDSGQNATLVLTGDAAITFTFLRARTANLWLTQGGAGGHLPDFVTGISWPGGTEPTWSKAAGKTDMISFISDGTSIIATAIIDYTL